MVGRKIRSQVLALCSLHILAGDVIVEITPLGAVHGVGEAALGVVPAFDAFTYFSSRFQIFFIVSSWE
jgi:hypothetical protein